MTGDGHEKCHARLEPVGHFRVDNVTTAQLDHDTLPWVGSFRNRDLHHSAFNNARLTVGSTVVVL